MKPLAGDRPLMNSLKRLGVKFQLYLVMIESCGEGILLDLIGFVIDDLNGLFVQDAQVYDPLDNDKIFSCPGGIIR